MANENDGIVARISDDSPLQLIKGQDQYIRTIQALPLEDGRLSFAVDSKKIYLDCDFTDPHGNTYQDRYAFGGGGGFYYGVREFSQGEIENSDFHFQFPDEFNAAVNLEVPQLDDLILNTDGCFYRIIAIDETSTPNVLDLTTTKLTVAGSGGGGGGGSSNTGLSVARHPDQVYTMIAANHSIPIGFKVTDSLDNTQIDMDVTINGREVGTISNVKQGEFTYVDLADRFFDYFVVNTDNTVNLRFTNEYGHAAQITYNGLRAIRLVDLQVRLVKTNLGVITSDTAQLEIQPFGGSSMYDRFINIRVHVPEQANPIVIQKEFGVTIDNGQTYVYTLGDLYIHGNYTVDVWITAHASQGDPVELSSPVVTATFIHTDSTANIPTLNAYIIDPKTVYNRYDTVTIGYLVAYNGPNSNMRLEAWCADHQIFSRQASVTNNAEHTFNVTLSDLYNVNPETNEALYKFIVAIDDYSLQEVIDNVRVKDALSEVPYIDETDNSLQLNLTIGDRANDDVDRDVWTYKDIACDFEDFNWSTNGWITENGVTRLRLTNGAKLYVPFAPFSEANTSAGQESGAQLTGKTIEIIFELHNVRDFSKILISAASQDIKTDKFIGIVGTGDKITMNTKELTNYMTAEQEAALTEEERASYNTRNGLRAYLAEDTRIHIAYSIQSKENGNRLIYTYVNGVISGIVQYGNNDSILDFPNSPSDFIIDSTYADIDLYGIRVYSNYATDTLLLNNYAASMPDPADRAAIGAMNAMLNTSDKISLKKVIDAGNIPYIVFTDLRHTGDKKGVIGKNADGTKQYGPEGTEKRLPINKEDFRWAPCYYVDPEDAKHANDPSYIKRSFGAPNQLVETVIYAQGTSSLAYPVKNLRMRFVNKKDKYSLRPAIPTEGITAEDLASFEHVPKVALFTLKADYMESSMAHNTGTGNALTALYKDAKLQTAAQLKYPDKTIVNNIIGCPIVAFWQTGETLDSAEFIGRYNFNVDKDSKDDAELFGFVPSAKDKFGVLLDDQKNLKWGFLATFDEELDPTKTYYTQPVYGQDGLPDAAYAFTGDATAWTDYICKTGPLYEYQEGPTTIQCWEFLNNAYALAGFRDDYDEDADTGTWNKTSKGKVKTYGKANWCAVFESRYPVYDNECCSDKRAFKRLIHWLHTTDQSRATGRVLGENEPKYGYTNDTKEYRLAKFVAELDDYMDREFTAFYYVLTEALLMVDSRAKNMMMCSFDIDSDAGTGHWFPIFYDMDTILGVDNTGVLRFTYDVDDETEQKVYNASANYGYYDDNGVWQNNVSYSTLWANFREGCRNDIASMYHKLRDEGKFSPEWLCKSYNTTIADIYAEVYDNKDAWYKYVRPLTEEVIVYVDGQPTTSTINMTQAAQGTRSLHRQYLLKHRFAYLDSKYPRATNEDIMIYPNAANAAGVNHPHPEENIVFHPVSSSTQFVSVSLEKSGLLNTIRLEPNVAGTTYDYFAHGSSLGDTKFYIYDLNDVYDLGDISNKCANLLTFTHPNKLRRLQLGHGDWVDDNGVVQHYSSGQTLNLGFLENCSLLEYLDIQGVQFEQNKGPEGALSKLPYLQTLLAKRSNLVQVSLVAGGNIKHMELPATVTNLYLHDNLYYDTTTDPSNLEIEAYGQFDGISISGCPRVDTYTLMNTIRQAHAAIEADLLANNPDKLFAEVRRPVEEDIDLYWEKDSETNTYIKSTTFVANKKYYLRNYVALNNLRLPDINWDITEFTAENADIVTVNDKTVVDDLKILDYMCNKVYGGYTVNDGTLTKYKHDNDYLAGTILLHNENVIINMVNIKQKYSSLFPYLIINVTNANNVVSGYDINIYNASTNEKMGDKSLTLSSVAAIGYNLKEYLDTKVKAQSYLSSVQYDYKFRGWSYSQSVKDPDQAVVEAALDIHVNEVKETNAQGIEVTNYIAVDAPTALTEAHYTNHELNLYPVFEMIERSYKVTFYQTLEGVSPAVVWSEQWLPFNTPVTMPTNPPAIINYDPDGDGDVSKTTIQNIDTFMSNGLPYNQYRATKNIDLYPIYKPAVRMQDVVEPPNSYFDYVPSPVTALYNSTTFVDPVTEQDVPLSEGILVTIKDTSNLANAAGLGAICVPKQIDGKWVVGINNKSTSLRRLYFERGCPIRYIMAPSLDESAGFNGTAYNWSISNNIGTAANVGFVYEGQTHTENGHRSWNTTLEFVDLAALTQLNIIGGIMDNNTEQYEGSESRSRIFAYCPNLHISGLPDSLMFISKYTFAEDASLELDHLPQKLTVVQERAFYQDTGLTDVIFNTAQWGRDSDVAPLSQTHNNGSGITEENKWPYIGQNAFAGCTNLHFIDQYMETVDGVETTKFRDTELYGIVSIGKQAFQNCTSLVWSIVSGITHTIRGISAYAFQGCTSLTLPSLPNSLVVLQQYAFSGCGTITLKLAMPSTIRTYGNAIFYNTTLHTGASNCILYVDVIHGGWYINDNVYKSMTISPTFLDGLIFDNANARIYMRCPTNSYHSHFGDSSVAQTTWYIYKDSAYGARVLTLDSDTRPTVS